MIIQLTFLPEVDRDETKKNVEAALEKYKIMLLMDPEELEPKITATFKLASSASTNEFYSTTEHVGIKRIDQSDARRKYIGRIKNAVNRLSHHQRSIINRYLHGEDVFDYEVYNELGFSGSKYFRIKSDAHYK